MKALISSDYFKSTVDLRRHRSGVMKPSCVLPAFAHKYAHRSQEFSICRNCAVSLPQPYRNKFDKNSGARRTRSALPGSSFKTAAPKSMHWGQHLCRAAQGERNSCWQQLKCLQPTPLPVPWLLYLLSTSQLCPLSLPLSRSLLSLFSIFLLSEYLPVTLSLFLCCHNLQDQLPILQASLCSQLPGTPCAASQPVLSFSKGTIERKTSSLG